MLSINLLHDDIFDCVLTNADVKPVNARGFVEHNGLLNLFYHLNKSTHQDTEKSDIEPSDTPNIRKP